MAAQLVVALVAVAFDVQRGNGPPDRFLIRLTLLIVRLIRSTWPFSGDLIHWIKSGSLKLYGWFGLVSRRSVPFASQIMSKSICR
ncbi:hypothetical protein [Defluviimonas salinarum]|uniref:Secreted protein n=1 Tax=Defluviimonas salinarum TaxID=2992147 RepID=A0ABT3J6Y0_9RHOB|nr:hypothetical protein [Defluviimonas salinarum]MCW3783436.1 hypothetical protein [Defluviimonas salinarum]